MDATRFVAPAFGEARRTLGRHGYVAFFPTSVTRSIDFHPSTVMLLSEADRALGRLAGAGRQLPNPHLLIEPYVTREAVSSSRIEGTQASLSDVFDAQARNSEAGPVGEVSNYIRALNHGLDRLEKLPVSKRLLCEVHAVLMSDVRGQEKLPGEIRRSPNWIGSPDNRPETAIFVPPPVDEMNALLDDLERFVHEDTLIPPLVKIALIHYQFETIHPFLDGNGRLGRLLIAFLLVEQDLLPSPLLYISTYFEQRRSDYYDFLQAVREEGALRQWIEFFLSGVTTQANEAVSVAEKLVDLRERYRGALVGDRSRAHEVLDLIFLNPVLTTRRVSRTLDTTVQSANNHIRRLEHAGIVTEVAGIPGRSKRWVSLDVLRTIDPAAPADFTRSAS